MGKVTQLQILTEDFLSKYPDFPEHMNELGKFVFLRTYSRFLEKEGRRETWKETCARAVEYNLSLQINYMIKNGIQFDIEEMRKEGQFLFDNQFNLRQSLSGRTNWVGGADTGVAHKFPLANFNCSFTNIESPKDLAELFYLLLVGTGVGFKVTNDLVDNFPRVNTKIKFVHKDYEYDKNRITKLENTTLEEDGEIIYLTVGDSKEGWVEALLYTFTILTDKKYSGVKEIHYNYDYVRPAGEPLKTFGGTASGPEPLREMFEGIDKVIHNQLDPHLEPLDVDEHGYAKLRAIHLVDISNLIGYNVVVGGVRRTSEIALGSDSDWEFILAKYGINGIWGDEGFERHEKIKQELIKLGIPIPKFWDELSVKYYYVYDKDEYRKAMNGEMSLADVRKIGEFTSPEEAIKCALENGYDEGEYFPYPCNEKRPLHHRRMSNNSIVFIHKPKRELLKLLFMLMESEGEPGFINLRAAAIRRLKAAGNENLTEEQIVKEAVKLGLNPCAEILLQSKGVCNLTTVNVMSFVKEDGSFDLSGLLEAQKASAKAGLRMTLVELELDKWNEVQQEDRLLGCSLTGWQDAMDVVGYDKEKQKVLLNILKETAIEEANKLADQLGVNRPLLVTTVKPEGTLSQVFGGVSSGLHFSHSPYYIRRIRINANDPLAKTVLAHKGWVINPEIGTPGKTREEKMRNARTLVIDFPIASGAKRTKDDVKVDEQFDIYFMFQEYYTQHNTSNTIHVHPDQWQRAEERVWEGWDNFVGVSFLAHNGGTYALAPYEAITKEEYEKRVAEMEALDYNLLKLFEVGADSDLDGLDGCEGGICPIR